MSRKHRREILEKFAEIAALAGLRGEVDEDSEMYVTGFGLPEGRSQMVYVRAIPEAIGDRDAVCIYSPCRILKTGFMKGLKKDQALELLKLNAKLLVARYAVAEASDGMIVIASMDTFIDTLEPDELEMYLLYVAMAADSYEKKYGQDEF